MRAQKQARTIRLDSTYASLWLFSFAFSVGNSSDPSVFLSVNNEGEEEEKIKIQISKRGHFARQRSKINKIDRLTPADFCQGGRAVCCLRLGDL